MANIKGIQNLGHSVGKVMFPNQRFIDSSVAQMVKADRIAVSTSISDTVMIDGKIVKVSKAVLEKMREYLIDMQKCIEPKILKNCYSDMFTKKGKLSVKGKEIMSEVLESTGVKPNITLQEYFQSAQQQAKKEILRLVKQAQEENERIKKQLKAVGINIDFEDMTKNCSSKERDSLKQTLEKMIVKLNVNNIMQ